MKTLVVFYSKTGHTKKVAAEIAEKLKADLEEIKDLKKRNGFFRWFGAGKDAMKKNITEIKTNKNPEDYDLIIVGSPVWARNVTPAVRTYLGKYNLSGKKLAFFSVSGQGKEQNIFHEMEKICKKPECKIMLKEKNIDPEKIDSFISEIKKIR